MTRKTSPIPRGGGLIDKDRANTYGVLVRAGALTPQTADESEFRTALGLPVAGSEVVKSWGDSGGVRRPITLATPADLAEPDAPEEK